MTDQERDAIRQMLREQSSLHKANPEIARLFLLRSGIYTPEGELKPEYGGAEVLSGALKPAS